MWHIHAYDYDNLGRLTQDGVATLGTGVDGSMRRIATAYEVRGMRAAISSYDNAVVGQWSVVKEVRFACNDFGQLTTSWQSHGGSVNLPITNSHPHVLTRLRLRLQ